MEAAIINGPNTQKGTAPIPAAPVTARVFVLDHDSEGIVRQSLADLRITDAQFTAGDARTAAKCLAKEKSPRLLIVDVAGIEDPAASMRELADVCDPEIHVVAIGDRNDIILYRDLKSTGVSEYFVKPLVRDVLTRMLDAVLNPANGPARPRAGKLIFFLGARGGSGTTTIATTAAWDLAESRRRRTILLDLDLQNGDAALQFDATPAHALREAIEHPERVDKLYLDRAVKHVAERLDLMASLEPLGAPADLREDAVLLLIEKLLNRYRFLLVDVPASAAVQLNGVLSLPSTCILVSNASLAAVRDVARWRECLGPNTPDRTTLHILNQTAAHGGLPAAEFARASGIGPDIMIPYDRDIAAATALGIKAMQKCVVFRRRLAPILRTLTGAPAAGPASLFRRVFG